MQINGQKDLTLGQLWQATPAPTPKSTQDMA